LCLRSLHHRFIAWTKPDTSSLLLGKLTDLARSKSKLAAENALLRRQVKRPACCSGYLRHPFQNKQGKKMEITLFVVWKRRKR